MSGTQLMTLNLGLRRVFKWKFCIADVSHPILGADFLSHFGLLVDQKLLADFPDLTKFAPISTIKNHGVEHHILTGQPIFSAPRKLSPEKLKFAKAEFVFMMEQGICRPSSSTWAAPLHMVPKPDKSWRLCGDYLECGDHS